MDFSKIGIWLVAALLTISSLQPIAARADDEITRAIPPHKWVAQYMPENLPPLVYPKYFKDFDKAKALAFAGRYKLSLMFLGKVTKADPAEVAIVKATCLSSLGRRDEALTALSDPAVITKPRVVVLRARILSDMGKNDQAIAALTALVQKSPTHIAAQYYLGEINERIGNTTAARNAYAAIHDAYWDGWEKEGIDKFDNAEDITLMGRAFSRWAQIEQKINEYQGLDNFILKMFTQAYDVVDTTYWPAHLAAAEYLASHDNEKEAEKEIKAALKGNPNFAPTHFLMGEAAVGGWNFDGADREIAALRALDPSSIPASLLECRNLLQQRRPTDALSLIESVLEKQPANLDALGLQAACYALQLKDDKTEEVLAKIDKLTPEPSATAYLEVAEQLGSMRQYPRSEAKYKVAIERAPWWTAARNGLGLLYTQSGDERSARLTLDAAKALDPFNHRTHNYIILLDMLDKMARKETDHFVIMYDAEQDPLIPEYFATYLEGIYKEVCSDFKQEPPVKTFIEVFPTHDAFSVRTTGSPWIGTVGASTGRVIALVSPRRGDATMGTFNWAQVLRHEFTHTVTLAATDNRIAHWMTEGLAVQEEHSPLRWEWVPMLYQAVKKHELFTMEGLTWGFVRPKRPIDRQLAYAQSAWICQYIEETWGHDTILKMLEEFRKGREQDVVFPQLLHKTLTEFSTDFFAWTEKQIATWGYDPETSKKYTDLRKKGDELVDKHENQKAVKVWEEIATLRPMDALPHQRLAGLYLDGATKDIDKATQHLLALHNVSLKDDRFAKKLARVNLEDGRLDDAQHFALDAIHIDPYDIEAHQALQGVYEKQSNAAGIAQEKTIIATLEKLAKKQHDETLAPGTPQ